jgi:hypothetical protein
MKVIKRKKKKVNLILDIKIKVIACIFFIGCAVMGCTSMTGGTHGSIKVYEYSVHKSVLEKAVWKVIGANSNIKRDTIYQNDGIKYGYYNDSINYISFVITKEGLANDYTFRYAGDSIYYDTSKVSAISIAYAWDKDNNGGHEGVSGKVKKELVNLFETEFVNKIDNELHLKHSETK